MTDHRLPLVIAHRGASRSAPENTMAAFRRAIDMGAQMIELDVRLSKDGRPVVIHDSLLHRTAQSRGRVEMKTFDELRRLDVGSWFDDRFRDERIPLLEEVLDLAAGRIGLNVELKCRRTLPAAQGLVAAVAGLVSSRDGVVVSSFHRRAIDAFRRMDTGIPSWYIYSKETSRPMPAHFERDRPIAIVQEPLATADLVALLHGRGGQVLVWTVDDPARMERLMDLDVDGIMSNCPDVLLQTREKWLTASVR